MRHAFDAHLHRNAKDFARWKHVWQVLQMLDVTQTLRSPRYYCIQADLEARSFWSHLRVNRRPGTRPGAWIRFLGLPPFIVDDLAEACRPYLARYDPDAHAGHKGRRAVLDYYDVVAVALRRLQIAGPLLKFLEQDFCVTGSVLSGSGRVIEAGCEALARVLPTLNDARICYPNKTEGDAMWKGATASNRIGKPPFEGVPIVLMMDGTTTAVRSVSSEVLQRLFVGSKGRSMNTYLCSTFGATSLTTM